jgi:hypothetical protein
MREHIAIERIECGVVDVRREDALFQVIEDDDADGAPQLAKRAFVELRYYSASIFMVLLHRSAVRSPGS